MEVYLESIKTAFLIFPFLAFLITLPYLLVQYHKYGSVPLIRSSIVYTFILYLLTAYFLVILPLPSKEEVIAMPTKVPQLIPFAFLGDFVTSFKEASSVVTFLKSPIVYTTLFNIAITIPFGIYLRYYFKKKLSTTIIYTFLLSLYFEITQLTGLYGLYPKAYRLFDVDDLIINTLGGVLGYLITPLVTIFLPARDEIDRLSYKRGKTVSIYRRFLAFLIDIFIFATIMFTVLTFLNFNNFLLPLVIIIILYYIILPTLTSYTLGKYIVKIKLDSKNRYKKISICIRQIILYFLIVFGPIIIIELNNYINGIIILFYILFITYTYFEICLKFFGRKKPLIYERLTKTENISTVYYMDDENEPSQDTKSVLKCNKEEVKDESRD